ncbi:MAG: hypothetical protein KF847_07775 [Pirellulales bacterium]|nr:hypothetical protein [Pirellulales bacterium]
MNLDEFSKQQYVALRAEISESKARIFWLLIVGMLLVIVGGYMAAAQPSGFANASIPLLILALMLSFIAESSNISRAGRYLREVVEPRIKDFSCWEHWLESHGRYREVDRAFVVGFNVVFLVFFGISASLSLRQLDMSAQKQQIVWAAGITYALGAACVAYVFARHWTASTKPSVDEPATNA